MEQNQPSGGQSQGEKEFVLDFSKFSSLSRKIDKRILVYGALIVILLISGYLRYLPQDTYPEDAPLGSADVWWQYRHIREIYEHGYPGTELVDAATHEGCASALVCLFTGGKSYWDSLHNAPVGASAPVEFYQYFVAYSYKYFFKLFFPSLIAYTQFTPLLFGVLATLAMFFLAREIFGNKAGLAASFIFGISTPFMQRSFIGQSDTDAIIMFFTILTAFLFFRAWNKKSLKWAAIGGVSLGFYGFTWTAGYTTVPLLIIAGAVIYYSIRMLELNFKDSGPLSLVKNYYLSLIGALLLGLVIAVSKNLALLLRIFGGALLITIFAIPALLLIWQNHRRIGETFSQINKNFILEKFPGKTKILWLFLVLLFLLSQFIIPLIIGAELLFLPIAIQVGLFALVFLFKLFWEDEARNLEIFAVFLIVGFGIVGIIIGNWTANLLRSVESFLTLRVAQRAPSISGTDIRNVFLTVAEFNPAAPRTIFFSVHIAPILIAIMSLFLIPFGLLKKIKQHSFFVAFLLLWLVSTYYASLNGNRFIQTFSIPVAILAGIFAGAYDYYNRGNKEQLKLILKYGPLVLMLIVLLLLPNISAVKGQPQFGSPYIPSSFGLANAAGGGEGENWRAFFKWTRENTPEDAIFASWWDPGHAFTALAERPAVADGSQNHKHVHDLAIMFTTNNITEAVELMKKYDISYFYTSTDLISKYGAISFLASGTGENYQLLTVDTSQVVESGNSVTVPYPFTIQTPQGDVPTSVVLTLKGSNYSEGSASWVIGNNPPRKIARVFYYNPQGLGYYREETSNDTIDMLLYVNPGYGNAFLLPPHIERNTLTKLHLFNGETAKENFELVNDFNGEIKVFRVKYN